MKYLKSLNLSLINIWPVGDQKSCVHKSFHTVGDTVWFPAGEAAARASSDAGVPANFIHVVHLSHQCCRLLSHLQLGLEISTSSPSSGQTEVRAATHAHALISRAVGPEK